MLDMRIKMAEYEGKKLDRKVLAKIMVLEYIRSSAFNKLAELAFNGTLTNALESLKDEKKKDKGVLHEWLSDDWLKKWLEILPDLRGQELTDYFYFARTSLDEKISRVSTRLSPEGQEILNELLSGTDTNLNKALKEIISDTEAINILEVIGEGMQKESKISKPRMKSFIKFSLKDSKYASTALSILKQLPVSSLSIPLMPLIAEFASETAYKEDVRALVEEWGKEDAELLKAFQNAL